MDLNKTQSPPFMLSPKAVLSPILYILHVSDICQPLDVQVNISQFADDIAIWAQAPGIRSINLRLQKNLNQIPTWCGRSRIKLNPGKTHLINFWRRKVIKDTSILMYGQPVKVTDSVRLLSVYIHKHLSIKLHLEDIERASLISTIRITRLNSINATRLICLYKIFTRPYTYYACTTLTALKKTETKIRGNSKPLSSICKKSSWFYLYFKQWTLFMLQNC